MFWRWMIAKVCKVFQTFVSIGKNIFWPFQVLANTCKSYWTCLQMFRKQRLQTFATDFCCVEAFQKLLSRTFINVCKCFFTFANVLKVNDCKRLQQVVLFCKLFKWFEIAFQTLKGTITLASIGTRLLVRKPSPFCPWTQIAVLNHSHTTVLIQFQDLLHLLLHRLESKLQPCSEIFLGLCSRLVRSLAPQVGRKGLVQCRWCQTKGLLLGDVVHSTEGW